MIKAPTLPAPRPAWLTLPNALFVLILGIGIFARVWEFPSLPVGLNQDEASIGLEAYDLLHYGVDRNNESFPVNFISWDNGMDALYGYILIPFVAFGLTPLTIRLPILISGILSLPLIYYVGKRTLGTAFGLLVMFFLAISPWHIMMSRWGINENIFPFVFLLGFVATLKSASDNRWFLATGFFMGLSLYAYGGAYAAVPVFLLCAVPILFLHKSLGFRTFLGGMLIFAALAVPIGLFATVNTLHLPTMHLGPFTVPRLPAQARFEFVAAVFSANPLSVFANNLTVAIRLIMGATDGYPWNDIYPYHYFYPRAYILSFTGAVLLVPSWGVTPHKEKWLMLSWLLAALSIGAMQTVNVNRFHLVFIPLIFCAAVCVHCLLGYLRPFSYALLLPFAIYFVLFLRDYHGAAYRREIGVEFFDGILPALDYAHSIDDSPICVTGTVNQPYLYVLFLEKKNPAEYVDQLVYNIPDAGFRSVRHYGRYSFGLPFCSGQPGTIYVLKPSETFEGMPAYKSKTFGNYTVYYP